MSVTELNLLEAVDAIKEAKVTIVDVLMPEHYERRHIPGAVNACVYEVVFPELMDKVAPERSAPILLYGAGPDSQDSRTAAEKLARSGYKDVFYFPGGLEEWRAEGYPLEGTAVEEVDPPHPELHLKDTEYALLPGESEFLWKGRNANGAHFGTVPLECGLLDVRHMTGDFELDMAGLRDFSLEGDEMQPVLENHLRSDDFFFVSMFPKATFRISAMQPVPDCPATLPNFRVMGTLQMRGVGKDVFMAVQLRNLDENRLVMQGNLDLDRTEWGVIYGSSRFFQHLGYHVVYDLISIEFRLVLEAR